MPGPAPQAAPLRTLRTEDPGQRNCLTDNNVVLDAAAEATPARNVQCGSTHTCDDFPTGLAGAASGGEVVFGEGHLTNRKAAYFDCEGGAGAARRRPRSGSLAGPIRSR